MKRLLLWGMTLALMLAAGCGEKNPAGETTAPDAPPPLSGSANVITPTGDPLPILTDPAFAAMSGREQRAAITKGMNAFGFALYPRLREGAGNVCYSPASLAFVLTMGYAGARGGTAREMAAVLHLPQVAPDDTDFHFLYQKLLDSLVSDLGDRNFVTIANGVWPQEGLPPNGHFVYLMTEHYRAGFQTLDFNNEPEQARATINRWGDVQTRGKVPDVLDPGTIQPVTVLVLTNAVYFNMEWRFKFAEEATEELPFYPERAKTVTVPTMIQKGDQRYFETDSYQALELDYDNDEFAMVLLLPRAKDGLAALEEILGQALADSVESFADGNVHLYLPRFSMRNSYRLEDALAAMGMPSAFQPGVADFSGILGPPGEIWVDFVVQKTFLEVTERGTEAAAVSAMGLTLGGGPPLPPPAFVEFRADHPFLFFIRHKTTGALLFMGRVTDPSAGA